MLFKRILCVFLLCAVIQIAHAQTQTVVLQESETALVCEDAFLGTVPDFEPDQNYGNSDTLISMNCPS